MRRTITRRTFAVAIVIAIALSLTAVGYCDTFSNAYGTSTTKCAHPGCNNPIASSGDTNCCTTHSRRCLNCGKYIDEDAMYCISCITDSVNRASSNSSKSSGNSSGKSSYSSGKSSASSASTDTQGNGYDMPRVGETFSDYVKRVDPQLYSDMTDIYNAATN